jgi:hypothetical protein
MTYIAAKDSSDRVAKVIYQSKDTKTTKTLMGASICWAAAEADIQFTTFNLSALKKQCLIFNNIGATSLNISYS